MQIFPPNNGGNAGPGYQTLEAPSGMHHLGFVFLLKS